MLYLRNTARVPSLAYDVITARRLDPMIRMTTIEASIASVTKEDVAYWNQLRAFRLRK